ncbi:hypothetical protein CQ006_13100 [Pseudomonas cedrina]|uniref:Uncharacterized protein n=1 Tax=Pseudomonas cedrina TaxID=651740 RepID=A0A2S9DQU3_PSECE|nr:hypothetical protein CLM72_13365 [Pseudomonas sp. MYb193]PRC04971.1 hypothetical protein CQ006_13100 [Pseudomonas cedrina]
MLDVGDTLIKGEDYLFSLGGEYLIRQIAFVLLCIVAVAITSKKLQMVLVLAAITYQVSWISRLYVIL